MEGNNSDILDAADHHQARRLLSDITMYPWNWAEGARRAELTLSATEDRSDDEDPDVLMSPASRAAAAAADRLRRGRPRADAITTLIIEGSKTENAIRCHICNRVFPREKSLQAHLRTHTGERPYVCDFPGCGRAFCQSGQLKTHQRLHTGEKPFICSAPGCVSRFTHANRHCPDHPMAALKRQPVPVPITPNIEEGENSQEIIDWIKRYNKKQERSISRTKSRSSRNSSSEQELLELENPKPKLQARGTPGEGAKKRKSRKPSKDSISKDVKSEEPAKKSARWSPVEPTIQQAIPSVDTLLCNKSTNSNFETRPDKLLPHRPLEMFNMIQGLQAEDLTTTSRSRDTEVLSTDAITTNCHSSTHPFDSVSPPFGNISGHMSASELTNSHLSTKSVLKGYITDNLESTSTHKVQTSGCFTTMASALMMTPQCKNPFPPRTPTSNSSLLQALTSPSPIHHPPSTPSNMHHVTCGTMTPQTGGSLPPAHMLLTPLRNMPIPFMTPGTNCASDTMSTPVRSFSSTPRQTCLSSFFQSPSPGAAMPLTPQNHPPLYRSHSPVRRIFCTPQNRVPLQECNPSPVHPPDNVSQNLGMTRLRSPSPVKFWSPYMQADGTPLAPLENLPFTPDVKQTPLGDELSVEKAPPSPVKQNPKHTVPLTPEVGIAPFQSPSPMKRPTHFSLRRTPLKKRLVRSAKPSAPVRRLVVDRDPDENTKENIPQPDTRDSDMGVMRLMPEDGQKRVVQKDDKWLGALALVELAHGSN